MMKRKADKQRKGTIVLAKMSSLNFVYALLFCALLLSGCGQSADTQQLFADNFEPIEMLLPDRGIGDDSKDTPFYNQARTEYKNKDYAAAAKTFQALSDQTPRSLAYTYYKGLSYLASGDAQTSIPIFQEILEAPRVTLVIHQSRWYLAMAYLKVNDVAKAKEMLENIEEGQFNYAEAKVLLGKL